MISTPARVKSEATVQCNARLGGAEQPRPLPRPRAGEHVADRDDEGETYSQIDIMRRTPGLVSTSQLTMGFLQN